MATEARDKPRRKLQGNSGQVAIRHRWLWDGPHCDRRDEGADIVLYKGAERVGEVKGRREKERDGETERKSYRQSEKDRKSKSWRDRKMDTESKIQGKRKETMANTEQERL